MKDAAAYQDGLDRQIVAMPKSEPHAPPEGTVQASTLRALAARHGVDLPAAALQFGAAHPVVVATIPGASSTRHLRRNTDLMEVKIPAAFWQELVAEGLLPAGVPLPA